MRQGVRDSFLLARAELELAGISFESAITKLQHLAIELKKEKSNAGLDQEVDSFLSYNGLLLAINTNVGRRIIAEMLEKMEVRGFPSLYDHMLVYRELVFYCVSNNLIDFAHTYINRAKDVINSATEIERLGFGYHQGIQWIKMCEDHLRTCIVDRENPVEPA
jgi:hypothetical protein